MTDFIAVCTVCMYCMFVQHVLQHKASLYSAFPVVLNKQRATHATAPLSQIIKLFNITEDTQTHIYQSKKNQRDIWIAYKNIK